VLRHDLVEARDRVLREARALAKLTDPGVVGVFDAGMLDEHVFLAMELVDGDTLRAWLAAQPRTWR
jgi:serine/threonine protein kinase